jgi:hypothetical protein
MRVNEENRDCNVADQQGRPDSIWTFWRDTLRMRKDYPTLVHVDSNYPPRAKLTFCLHQIYGTFELVPLPDYPDVIAYTRTHEDDIWLFVGNFGKTSLPLQVAQIARGRKAELVCSTLGPADSQDLQPLEARLYRLV